MTQINPTSGFFLCLDDVRVLLSVTEESLHNRNLSHFGITTLRSTISYNLLQVAKPEMGDLILDPLCGSGSIPIEVLYLRVISLNFQSVH